MPLYLTVQKLFSLKSNFSLKTNISADTKLSPANFHSDIKSQQETADVCLWWCTHSFHTTDTDREFYSVLYCSSFFIIRSNTISCKWSQIKEGPQRSYSPWKDALILSLPLSPRWDNVLIRPLPTSAADRSSRSCAFLSRTWTWQTHEEDNSTAESQNNNTHKHRQTSDGTESGSLHSDRPLLQEKTDWYF